MTASEIRNSFLTFFENKQHTIVPSASLLPQSPGLLFTNAGMNQFVPYFLGTEKPPFTPSRATDTQKCIRAGGKHNDLEDVGHDSYHHTFFEMLGNWSFGDYFKTEAIHWSWELLTEIWGFPPARLYASIYRPAEGDPGVFDEEAHRLWSDLFRKAGLDPDLHVVDGNVADNFWMMGETGPCGPCSELHIDLTEAGDSKGALVNGDSDRCIEIWNLVFIQYNAEADGSFRELPARHVDTGMGFERVCSVLNSTKNFTDYSARPSNYATDVFTPLFTKLEELSGARYGDIYPEDGQQLGTFSDELKRDVALRVIADHIRTLSLSIADGILPGNTSRNYVLRRILRRAVRYGRQLGFDGSSCFMPQLVDTLVDQLGDVFPELKARRKSIKETLEREETSFNETLDRGLAKFEVETKQVKDPLLSGDFAFQLYDTFGFPIDLTQLLARERGLSVDMERFQELMEQQRERARAAGKSTVIKALEFTTDAETEFTGFDQDESDATILEIHPQGNLLLIITDRSPFYAEMGGQQGDQGTLTLADGSELPVTGVQKVGAALAHIISAAAAKDHALLKPGTSVSLQIDQGRRRGLEAHHSATHLLHWALRETVSQDAAQQGSLVAPDRLRFDFTSSALSPAQITAIEEAVNQAIVEDAQISVTEVPHADIKGRTDIQQFFGDKYGELVRVVQIGGEVGQLNGYSMELCGGTHLSSVGDIGLFKIKSEGAIASGVRRIEALTGAEARRWWRRQREVLLAEEKELSEKIEQTNRQLSELDQPQIKIPEFPRVMEGLLLGSKDFANLNATWNKYLAHIETLRQASIQADKAIKKAGAAGAAREADGLLNALLEAHPDKPLVLNHEGEASLLQELLNGVKKRQFAQTAVFVVDDGTRLHLGIHCGKQALEDGLKAGELIRELAVVAGGKGGGKPDQARGAAPNRAERDALAAAAVQRLSS